MALRYLPEDLLYLRDSPLCIKPAALPPAEEWMGPPPDNFRNNNTQPKPSTDARNRNNDNPLLDPNNRRPGVDRHVSRNSGNSESIVLGPPRTTFSSATQSKGSKPFDLDKPFKEGEVKDRFAFRTRNGEGDGADRFRDRDGRNNFRRRGEGDQDSDGWSTVKPRKSFGTEGAERFHGRMGDRPERIGADRRPRETDETDSAERPRRNFGEFAKEKDADDGDRPRRNGLNNRNKPDQPWARDGPEQQSGGRERFDKARSWRERAAAPEDGPADRANDRQRERGGYDRRWDRDHHNRQDREPEWFDEPADEKPEKRTQADFQKFMESMKAGKSVQAAEQAAADTSAREVEAEKPRSKPTPAMDLGPDKFFAAFAPPAAAEKGPGSVDSKENTTPAPKPKSGSRFQNFFSSQEEARRQTEAPIPAPVPAPTEVNPLLALAMAQPQVSQQHQPPPESGEKVAFQALLQKLQKQSAQTSTPPNAGFAEPPPPPPPGNDMRPGSSVASPRGFPYGQERHEDPLTRAVPPNQELHAPRPQQQAQVPGMRPEQQMLHDLVGQRQSSAQGHGRPDQPPSRTNNRQAEFLMTLMQSSRGGQDGPRNEHPIMRMPQPSRPAQIPPTPEREASFQRDHHGQPMGGRPSGLQSFFDEVPVHAREPDVRQPQPTQILQRQQSGPPGLEQMAPPSWMQAGGAPPLPTPGRPMIPPPGLAGNPRNGPAPGGPAPGMFPPNFPMGAFPPPESMAGPPRNMAPPPGFFGGPNGPPPPGFMPPPGMGGFQGPGPEPLFGYDGRGMPPPGGAGPFRRN